MLFCLGGGELLLQVGSGFEVGAIVVAPVFKGGVGVARVDFDEHPAEGQQAACAFVIVSGEPYGFGLCFEGRFLAFARHDFDLGVAVDGFAFGTAVFAEA